MLRHRPAEPVEPAASTGPERPLVERRVVIGGRAPHHAIVETGCDHVVVEHHSRPRIVLGLAHPLGEDGDNVPIHFTQGPPSCRRDSSRDLPVAWLGDDRLMEALSTSPIEIVRSSVAATATRTAHR